ncbi:MAG: hypothetical protein MJ168_10540 [Clostridia bacterium]|nr:hypothetical protein [Clostridia bacterium]
MALTKFPDGFPDNLYDLAVEDGADHNFFDNVYRISDSGKINRETFVSSCAEPFVNRDRYLQKEAGYTDIGDYSTSFFKNIREAKGILNLKKKYQGFPKLIIGNIYPCFGLSMYTCESKSSRHSKKSHIDLWKFEHIDPSPYFNFVEEE